MITLEMDMVQYDCPYIDTTLDHDVSFFTKQWDFDTETQSLETRIMVGGDDREALNRGLDALTDHPNMQGYELLRRKRDKAFIKSEIAQTNAMKVIRDNDGYITGPFRIKGGSETWHIGFDSRSVADETLAELDRNNDFQVESRDEVDIEDYYDVIQNRAVAKDLLDVCRTLSKVEADTLERAVDDGYFTDPRGTTLSSIADDFDVSKMAVSKNLRRSQRKVLDELVEALSRLED